MIKIEIKDGKFIKTCKGSQNELAVETVVIVQTLAKSLAKTHGLSETDAVDVIAASAKRFLDKLETETVEGTEIYILGDKKVTDGEDGNGE